MNNPQQMVLIREMITDTGCWEVLFQIAEMVPSDHNLDEYYQIKSQINSFWHFLCVVVAKMSKKSKKIGLFRHNSQLLNSHVLDA